MSKIQAVVLLEFVLFTLHALAEEEARIQSGIDRNGGLSSGLNTYRRKRREIREFFGKRDDRYLGSNGVRLFDPFVGLGIYHGAHCQSIGGRSGSEWQLGLAGEPAPWGLVAGGLAAREIVKYVQRISGATLEIVEEETPSNNVIRIDSGNGDLDGFDLTVAPERITIHGHTPRGALYGAYQLLEDMGCRWFYISELSEVIPKRSNIALLCRTDRQAASFRERSVMVAYPSYYERFEEWIDYLTKLRVNNIVIYGQEVQWWMENRGRYLPHLKERQTILEFGGHILPTFVPRDLFADHPDYFRMNEKGERTADHNFCPRSGAMSVLRENVRGFFSDLSEITYFHIWADDLKGGGWCHCDKCRDLSPQDQNVMAMNAVAEVLADTAPHASLALLAYHDTAQAPGVHPAPNLFLFHAPRERCYVHAFNDPKCRRNREEYMADWLTLRAVFLKTAPDTIHEFSYYTDALLDREMQPPQVQVIPADARYFRSLGLPVYQNLMVAFRGWHSPPFSLVNFARAAWDADINGWDVLQDFCTHYYGESLGPDMVSYYRSVEEACNLLFEGDPIVGPYIDMCWPPLDAEMRKAKIADVKKGCEIHAGLEKKLAALLERAPNGIINERIRRERDVCALHNLIFNLARCQFEGRFLGFQYVAGNVTDEEGRKAARLLAEGKEVIRSIQQWVERYPEEQKGMVSGWKNYFGSYEKVFALLETQVREKLARDE